MWHVLIGTALAIFCGFVSVYVFAWMAPIIVGQALAVALSTLTSKPPLAWVSIEPSPRLSAFIPLASYRRLPSGIRNEQGGSERAGGRGKRQHASDVAFGSRARMVGI